MAIEFSSVSSETLIGRAVRLPLRLVPRTLAVPILQGPSRGQRWIVGSSTHGCWLGSFELAKQRSVAENLAPGAVFFDIGANVGFYSLLAARIVGPTGRVVAIEPVRENVAYLTRHLELNDTSNVMVVERALSDSNGVVRFAVGDDRSSGRILTDSQLRHGGERTVAMQTSPLDDLIVEGGLPRPTHLKIDVEGGEVALLRGATRVLAEDRPMIWLATHGRDLAVASQAILRGAGYRIEPLTPTSGAEPDEFIAVHS